MSALIILAMYASTDRTLCAIMPSPPNIGTLLNSHIVPRVLSQFQFGIVERMKIIDNN